MAECIYYSVDASRNGEHVNRRTQSEIALTQTNMDGSNCTVHTPITNRNMNSISFYYVALAIGLSEDVCLGALEPSFQSAAFFYRFGNANARRRRLIFTCV